MGRAAIRGRSALSQEPLMLVRMKRGPKQKPRRERFYERVDRGTGDGCWRAASTSHIRLCIGFV